MFNLTKELEKKYRKGFTIIEIIVVIGVTSILMSAAVIIFFQVIQTSNRAQSVNEIRQSGNQILETMVREIRKAKGVKAGCAVSGVYHCLTTYYDSQCLRSAAYFYLDGYEMKETTYDFATLAPSEANLTSKKVAIIDCPTINGACTTTMAVPPTPGAQCSSGFIVVATDRITEAASGACLTEAKLSLTLKVQQNNPQTRSEFCGKVILKQSVATRNY